MAEQYWKAYPPTFAEDTTRAALTRVLAKVIPDVYAACKSGPPEAL